MEPQKTTWEGKAMSIAFIGIGVLIGSMNKNYKNPAFWAGVTAMFIAGVSVKTYNKPTE